MKKIKNLFLIAVVCLTGVLFTDKDFIVPENVTVTACSVGNDAEATYIVNNGIINVYYFKNIGKWCYKHFLCK